MLVLAAALSVLAATGTAVILAGGGSTQTIWHQTATGGEGGAAPAPATAPGRSGNPFAKRVPAFPPPPAAERIALPTGPYAPIFSRLPVTAPVAFLTIDDGWVRQPQAIQLMAAAHIPFTMFLIAPVAASDPVFFRQLESAGGAVEDHTVSHPILRGKSYAFQRNQICGAEPALVKAFGRQPELFRPPFGDYDRTTLKVVRDCGLKAAFFWAETVRNGRVFYQTSVHRIARGDIILMHFRNTFVADVLAALTAIHDAGLTPALLEDYIG